MIRNNTIEAVYPLAELLAKKGIEVTSIGESPIEKLIIAADMPVPKLGLGEERPSVIDLLLEGSRHKGHDGLVAHDVIMTSMVDIISKTVRGNLSVARNVVNPIIKDVVADTEEYIAKALDIKSTHVQIKPLFFKGIFNSISLPDMVERFKETSIKPVDLTLGIEFAVDRESMFNLAKTNAERFDKELMDFCADLTEEEIANTFNSVFGMSGLVRSRLLSDSITTQTPDKALLVHLFARGLLQDPPAGLNIGLTDYRAYMSNVLAQSGRILLSIIAKRESDLTRKIMVHPFPSNENLGHKLITLTVNGEVYNQWLKDGGTPETLLGSFASNGVRGYSQLLENKAKYEATWTTQEKILTTRNRLEKFNEAVSGIELAIAKQINEIDEELLPVPKNILHQRLKGSLSGLYGKFYDNLPEYARKLVCDVMFPHTNALEILCAIDNVCSDFPEMEIREAALLATIEVVSNWVVKLCVITDKSGGA